MRPQHPEYKGLSSRCHPPLWCIFLDPFPKKGADSRLTRFTFVSLSFMLLVISAQAQPPAQTEEWKQLFNGKDLTGWKHVGPGQMTVGDGLIRTHGGMGLLYWTGGKLGNCVIRVVFKMHDHNDNSGVYIRTPIEPREPWMPVHILEPAMAMVISMLRGVNLGSHNRIKMDALRAL